MTKQLDREAIILLVRSHNLADIVGAIETISVDFKGAPYRLEEERQKYELAKDVASFANAGGGIIVIGIPTIRSETQPTDVAQDARPVPVTLIEPARYESIIASWIYPTPVGCSVTSYPNESGTHVIAIVDIPAQADSLGPFVVTKTVSPDAERSEGSLIGVFERRAATSHPLSAPEIQALLRDGRLFRNAIDQRPVPGLSHASVERQKPDELQSQAEVASTSPGEPSEEVKAVTLNRAANLVEALGLASEPTLVVSAVPLQSTSVPGLFASEDDPIVEALRSPPIIRKSGFDLRTGAHPTIHGGQSRRALFPTYKGLELWRDGTLIFAATGGQEFLSWGERDDTAPYTVHPVPLMESLLVFCKLVTNLASMEVPIPKAISFEVHLRRMCVDGQGPILKGGAPIPWTAKTHYRGPCDLDVTRAFLATEEAGRIAYELVKEVYLHFNLTYDRVPYVRDGKIDEEAIRRL